MFGLGVTSTATVERCKMAFFTGQNAGCDPDLSWWDWANMPGNITPWACDDARKKYFGCVASGIPNPPAPAPPPIQTSEAGWHDPTLPQQADDATRARQAGYADTVRHYLDVVTGSDDSDGTGNPLGIKTEYLLYGALAVAGVLLVRGRR